MAAASANSSVVVGDVTAVIPSSAKWRLCRAVAKPPARAGHVAAVYGNRMFVFGGETRVQPAGAFLSDMWAFDLDKGEWAEVEQQGALQLPREGHAAVVFKDVWYIVGGTTPHGHSNTVHAFNFATNTWTDIETLGQPPEPCCRHSCVVVNAPITKPDGSTAYSPHIAVYGGWNWKKGFRDLYLLTLDSFEWRRVKLEGRDATCRIWHTCNVFPALKAPVKAGDDEKKADEDSVPDPVTKSEEMFVFAGEDEQTLLHNELFSITECKQFARTQWDVRSSAPGDRYGHCTLSWFLPLGGAHDLPTVTASRSLLLVGGYPGDPALMYNDVWFYNLALRMWRQINTSGDILPGVTGHSVVEYQGRLYVYGGAVADMSKNEHVYELTLDAPSATTAASLLAAEKQKVEAEHWSCEACTYNNPLSAGFCSVCGTQRPRLGENNNDELSNYANDNSMVQMRLQQHQLHAFEEQEHRQSRMQAQRRAEMYQPEPPAYGDEDFEPASGDEEDENPLSEEEDEERGRRVDQADADLIRQQLRRQRLSDQPEAEWDCPACTFHNTGRVRHCAMCGTAKP